MTIIAQLQPGDFESFFAYLNHHLADNGRDGTGYFQPVSQLV